jgi:hypothetical protein
MGKKRFRTVLATAVCGALTLAGTAACVSASTTEAVSSAAIASASRPTINSSVSVNARGKSVGTFNGQYIGLSYESSSLNFGDFRNVGDLVRLLRNLGNGVLRFGGDSVDTPTYQGATPAALKGLAGLLKATGWSALYSVNLGNYNAAADVEDVKRAAAALGPRLAAVACGNEPNAYPYIGMRPRSYTEGDYQAQADTCLEAIHAAAPKVPIEGPDTSSKGVWFTDYAAKEKGTVSWLGQHFYPLGCSSAMESEPASEVAQELIGQSLANSEVSEFRWAAAAARGAHAKLHFTETNTVCNGGMLHLSNTYSTALWAIDYILAGAENGVAGMNFHGGIYNTCLGYTPLCRVGANDYQPEPIYYGMVFAHMLGSGSLLPTDTIVSSSAGHLAAFALKPANGTGLRVMVENLSQDPTAVKLKVGTVTGTPIVARLTGPSLTATSGVAITGEKFASSGLLPQMKWAKVSNCTASSCEVTVAPYSAALVVFH